MYIYIHTQNKKSFKSEKMSGFINYVEELFNPWMDKYDPHMRSWIQTASIGTISTYISSVMFKMPVRELFMDYKWLLIAYGGAFLYSFVGESLINVIVFGGNYDAKKVASNMKISNNNYNSNQNQHAPLYL